MINPNLIAIITRNLTPDQAEDLADDVKRMALGCPVIERKKLVLMCREELKKILAKGAKDGVTEQLIMEYDKTEKNMCILLASLSDCLKQRQ